MAITVTINATRSFSPAVVAAAETEEITAVVVVAAVKEGITAAETAVARIAGASSITGKDLIKFGNIFTG
jgi:hypothetical protein